MFQSEAKCRAIDMKMIFYFHANKTEFCNKDFVLSLVVKVRIFGIQNGVLSHSFWSEMISMPDLSVVIYQSALWNVLGSSSS